MLKLPENEMLCKNFQLRISLGISVEFQLFVVYRPGDQNIILMAETILALSSIPLSPVTHCIITPIDGSAKDEDAALLLTFEIQRISSRIFNPIKDVLWLRNAQFHQDVKSAQETTVRIPIIVSDKFLLY